MSRVPSPMRCQVWFRYTLSSINFTRHSDQSRHLFWFTMTTFLIEITCERKGFICAHDFQDISVPSEKEMQSRVDLSVAAWGGFGGRDEQLFNGDGPGSKKQRGNRPHIPLKSHRQPSILTVKFSHPSSSLGFKLVPHAGKQ